MSTRNWVWVGLLIGLGLIYVLFFTEWLRPAPIDIASQIRFSVQPPRFGRPVDKNGHATNKLGPAGERQANVVMRVDPSGDKTIQTTTKLSAAGQPGKNERPAPPAFDIERIGSPNGAAIDQSASGVASVTFSLDQIYQLTRIRVEDVPADGSAPMILWNLKGKSRPLNSLLYSRAPEGMTSVLAGSTFEPLQPGVPYRLILEAGRRRGTNFFKTVPAIPLE